MTRDRREALGIVLDHLERLPIDEIVIVDNGSEGGTAELVRDRSKHVVLVEPGRNTGTAGRNLGASIAQGDFLLQLDDDAYPLPGAVEVLLEGFSEAPWLS